MSAPTHEASDVVIIGAGLMRTGTHSLKVALEKLLDGRCYHMADVIANPPHIDFWLNSCIQAPSDDEWRSFLKGFKAAVDFPPCAFYERLMELYPDAKVILTTRDPDSWFNSVSNTIVPFLERRLETAPQQNLIQMLDHLYSRAFEKYDLKDRELMVSVFRRHVEAVRRKVPADRLLVFEARDGWRPLCDFLGVTVPDEPYPLTNTTAEFFARFNPEPTE